jgi:hypothetical protein
MIKKTTKKIHSQKYGMKYDYFSYLYQQHCLKIPIIDIINIIIIAHIYIYVITNKQI